MSAIICPTVTAETIKVYRDQLQNIHNLSHRIHLDFMDGTLTPNTSITLKDAWWQKGPMIDLHIMSKYPLEMLEQIVSMQPHMVIIHAEAAGIKEFLEEMEGLGIKCGLALLQDTTVGQIKKYLPNLDHVLIFSGVLGKFGGKTDLHLLEKVWTLKQLKPGIEIGWDGGINDQNIKALSDGGVDVLNVGGYIQKAKNAEDAYDKLEEALRG